MVGILGIVEESGWVHLRPQMLDLVEVGRRASDRVCKRESTPSRRSCLEPELRIAAESIAPVMIDVMLQMPVIPIEVTIECLHRCATATP